MEIIPDDISTNGTQIYAKFGSLNWPLDDNMVRRYCGHLPETDIRAWAMAKKLKGKVLEFQNNISFGKESKLDKRKERIERRKRREAGIVKVTIKFVLEEGYDEKQILRSMGMKLLTLEGLKKNPIKDTSNSQVILAFDNKIKQAEFYEKLYPKIIEMFEDEVKEFTGVSFAD